MKIAIIIFPTLLTCLASFSDYQMYKKIDTEYKDIIDEVCSQNVLLKDDYSPYFNIKFLTKSLEQELDSKFNKYEYEYNIIYDESSSPDEISIKIKIKLNMFLTYKKGLKKIIKEKEDLNNE